MAHDCCDWDLLEQVFDEFEQDEIILYHDQPLMYTIKTNIGFFVVSFHNSSTYSRRILFHMFDITQEMRDILVTADWHREDFEEMHKKCTINYMLYYSQNNKSIFKVTKPFKLS